VTEKNHRPGVLWTVAVLTVGFVLYVLSSGPMAWLIGRCGWPDYLLVPYEVIYKPLEMAQDALPANVGAPYDRYMAWWLSDFVPSSAAPSSSAPAVAIPESGEVPEEGSAELPR